MVAGQAGGTIDYYPLIGQNQTYDPVLNGGSMTSMTIFAADGVTPQQVSTSVAKISDGRYRFTFATALAAAGTFALKTIYSATGTGPVVTDTNDVVVVYAFGGGTGSVGTLADLKATLNDTSGSTANDAELQRFLDAALPVIESITGPIAPRAFFETHDGGRSKIVLRQLPVISIASLTEYTGVTPQILTLVTDPSMASTYSYSYDPQSGLVDRRVPGGVVPFAAGTDNILVTYTAGYAVTPGHIYQAVLLQAAFMYQSTQLGGRPSFNGNASYGGAAGSGFGFGIPNMVRQLVEPAQHAPGIY
jgi:hypothetical protein